MFISITIFIIIILCMYLNTSKIRKILCKKAYNTKNTTLNEPLIDFDSIGIIKNEEFDKPNVLIYNSPFNKSKNAGFYIETQNLDDFSSLDDSPKLTNLNE